MADPSHEQIDGAVQNMKSWYECLIKASNIVFELEAIARRNCAAGT
jgi:hypothetical protein